MSRRAKPIRYAMSRNRKNALMAVFFLFILPALVVVDRQLLRPVRQAVRMAVWAGDDRKRYHEKTFAVAAIIDGDTFDIAIPDGDKPTTRIRLIGVDTPETWPPEEVMHFGPQATQFVKARLEGNSVTLLLDTVGDERCRYGRLLAYAVLSDEKVLNEILIAEGYGYADSRFKHSQLEAYTALMETAIEQKRGLWEEARSDDLPQWLRRHRRQLLR